MNKKSRFDVYGNGIYDQYKGKEAFEIIERDDGLIELSPIGFRNYLSSYKEWPAHEKKALELVKGRVLDLGCGAGRHSLYLQENGFSIVAVDNSKMAINVCKLRGLKQVHLMKIEDIPSSFGKFDSFLLLGINFGLLRNPKKAYKLLKKYHKIANKNAFFFAESIDVINTQDPVHLSYHHQNIVKGKFPGQLKIRLRYRKSITPWVEYFLPAKDEISKVIKNTGWKINRFIESTDTNDQRYIVILQKI